MRIPTESLAVLEIRRKPRESKYVIDVDVIAVRRDLHAHPELAFAETRTTQLILDALQAIGLRPRVLPGGTGVVV